MAETGWTSALLAVSAAELVAVTLLAVLLARSRRQARQLLERLARPRGGAVYAASRAVSAIVETATRMHAVGGLLMSSLDELNRWVREDRAEIARVSAPDGTVTIFFSDVEDSTALNERLGDKGWLRVLDAHDALVRRQLAAHGGHVVKSQGDGFMVVFGEPAAAVRAALGIQHALSAAPPRRLRATPIAVRIGVHVGRAITRDGDYFGRNVALCARVAACAGGGEVLISDEVRARVENELDLTFERLDGIELKGFAEAHTLWLVSAVSAVSAVRPRA